MQDSLCYIVGLWAYSKTFPQKAKVVVDSSDLRSLPSFDIQPLPMPAPTSDLCAINPVSLQGVAIAYSQPMRQLLARVSPLYCRKGRDRFGLKSCLFLCLNTVGSDPEFARYVAGVSQAMQQKRQAQHGRRPGNPRGNWPPMEDSHRTWPLPEFFTEG